MKKENNENLQELLAKFLDAREASKAVEDIFAGEHVFNSNPAPEPAPALLKDIKQRMAVAAAGRNGLWTRHFVWQLATAAAAIVVVVWAGMAFLQKSGETGQFNQAQAREAFWQEASDDNIDSKIAQLDQKESGTPIITFETNAGSETMAVSDVTDELDEIGNSFWEG